MDIGVSVLGREDPMECGCSWFYMDGKLVGVILSDDCGLHDEHAAVVNKEALG